MTMAASITACFRDARRATNAGVSAAAAATNAAAGPSASISALNTNTNAGGMIARFAVASACSGSSDDSIAARTSADTSSVRSGGIHPARREIRMAPAKTLVKMPTDEREGSAKTPLRGSKGSARQSLTTNAPTSISYGDELESADLQDCGSAHGTVCGCARPPAGTGQSLESRTNCVMELSSTDERQLFYEQRVTRGF